MRLVHQWKRSRATECVNSFYHFYIAVLYNNPEATVKIPLAFCGGKRGVDNLWLAYINATWLQDFMLMKESLMDLMEKVGTHPWWRRALTGLCFHNILYIRRDEHHAFVFHRCIYNLTLLMVINQSGDLGSLSRSSFIIAQFVMSLMPWLTREEIFVWEEWWGL